jgi:hypothetical protein
MFVCWWSEQDSNLRYLGVGQTLSLFDTRPKFGEVSHFQYAIDHVDVEARVRRVMLVEASLLPCVIRYQC